MAYILYSIIGMFYKCTYKYVYLIFFHYEIRISAFLVRIVEISNAIISVGIIFIVLCLRDKIMRVTDQTYYIKLCTLHQCIYLIILKLKKYYFNKLKM